MSILINIPEEHEWLCYHAEKATSPTPPQVIMTYDPEFGDDKQRPLTELDKQIWTIFYLSAQQKFFIET